MTRAQEATLAVFFGLLSATIALAIAYDFWLAETGPDDATTISWVLDLLGFSHPFATYMLGFLSASFTVGLAAHIWTGMPSPAIWKELVDRRWQMAQLRSQGVVIPTVPDDLDYN